MSFTGGHRRAARDQPVGGPPAARRASKTPSMPTFSTKATAPAARLASPTWLRTLMATTRQCGVALSSRTSSGSWPGPGAARRPEPRRALRRGPRRGPPRRPPLAHQVQVGLKIEGLADRCAHPAVVVDHHDAGGTAVAGRGGGYAPAWSVPRPVARGGSSGMVHGASGGWCEAPVRWRKSALLNVRGHHDLLSRAGVLLPVQEQVKCGRCYKVQVTVMSARWPGPVRAPRRARRNHRRTTGGHGSTVPRLSPIRVPRRSRCTALRSQRGAVHRTLS